MSKSTDNNVEDIKSRRLKDILISSGTGVILFAIWGVVRTILNFTLVNKNNNEDLSEIFSEMGVGQDVNLFFTVSAVITIVVLAAEVSVRVYVGLSARAEGKGKKKGWAYVVIACIMIPLYIIGIAAGIINIVTIHTGVIDLIVTVIVEITSLFAFIELVVSAIKLKKIKKQRSGRKGGEAV